MSLKSITLGLGILLSSFTLVQAETDDHVVQPDTVLISLSNMSANPDGIGALDLSASVKNMLSVSIILREVTAGDVAGKMMKKSSLFGNVVWREIDFLNVRPRQTMVFGDKIKLVFPAGAQGAQEVSFSFGPKGGLTIAR